MKLQYILLFLSVFLIFAISSCNPKPETKDGFKEATQEELIGTWDIYGTSSVPMITHVEKNDFFQGWLSLDVQKGIKGQLAVKDLKTGTFTKPNIIDGKYEFDGKVLSTIVDGKVISQNKIAFQNQFLVTITPQKKKELNLYIYYMKRPEPKDRPNR